jgi:hypothetical protein
MAAMQAAISRQLEPRQRVLVVATDYLHQLQVAKQQFQHWLLDLQAGSHAKDIPPPPQWPTPPAELAVLSQPFKVSLPPPSIPTIKKEEHPAHSVASTIAKALFKVKPRSSHLGKAAAHVELPEYRLRNEREAALWYCLAARNKTATRKQHEGH